MNEIIVLPTFEKGAKRLIKKYKSLADEITAFISKTETDGIQGITLGNGIFKSRLAVKSKSKGKSGGLRVISFSELYYSQQNDTIFLVAIYDKSEISSMNKSDIEKILKDYK